MCPILTYLWQCQTGTINTNQAECYSYLSSHVTAINGRGVVQEDNMRIKCHQTGLDYTLRINKILEYFGESRAICCSSFDAALYNQVEFWRKKRIYGSTLDWIIRQNNFYFFSRFEIIELPKMITQCWNESSFGRTFHWILFSENSVVTKYLDNCQIFSNVNFCCIFGTFAWYSAFLFDQNVERLSL